MSDRQLTVGVLAGMGPYATIDFMSKVLAATPAEEDQDHIRMIVEHNPKVPNRQEAIRRKDPAVGRELAAMAERLQVAGADFLVMPCNSAHAFLAPIRLATTIPFISIVDETMAEIDRAFPSARQVGVLATDGFLEAGVYQKALQEGRRMAVLLPEGGQATLMSLIHDIKAGAGNDELRHAMSELAQSLVSNGADLVIAGCTEIPLVLDAGDLSVPLLSSTDILARKTVALAMGRTPFPIDPFPIDR